MTRKNKQKRQSETVASRELVADEGVEIFLNLRGKQSSIEDWEKRQQFVDASPEQAQLQDELEDLWRTADNLSASLMPSDAEIASDMYSGSESVQSYLIHQEEERYLATPTQLEVFVRGVSHLVQQLFAPRVLMGSAAAACLVLFSFAMLPPSVEEYRTNTGEHRHIALEDGSVVILGARSQMEVEYVGDTRQIALISGEAFFEVEPDEARPFVVSSNNIEVKAVGTAFHVQTGSQDLIVSVTEGVVHVDTPGVADPVTASEPEAVLGIGDQLTVSLVDYELEAEKEHTEKMLFWKGELLYFNSEELGGVVERLDRYSDIPIVIDDAAVSELLFSGSVNRRSIDNWLDTLPFVFPVTVEHTADRIMITSAGVD